jgi:hypothetical protein
VTSPDFLFTVCQRTCESALQQEVARRHPDLRSRLATVKNLSEGNQ